MCLIFIALKAHPDYKMIIAANRDEFYTRRTAAAGFWPDHGDILGGRDLEAGGTWLAISRMGKIGMVTNFRDPDHINPSAPSRGALIVDYITSHQDAESYTKHLKERANRYNGFNLLTGTPDELWYCSNYSDKISRLSDGVFGLSNHLIETPWPKVAKGKEKFLSMLDGTTIEPERLLEFLYNDEVAPDDLLPDTGVGIERERALSSMFIKSPGYGTRCSTVILIDNENNVSFSERVYDVSDFSHSTRSFNFSIEKILQN